MNALEAERPPFDEPWQAQVFALTVHLSEQGLFTWPEWAEAFGGTLREAARAGRPDDGSLYYMHWLAALERLLVRRGAADGATLAALKEAWADSYRRTPHGSPVAPPVRGI